MRKILTSIVLALSMVGTANAADIRTSTKDTYAAPGYASTEKTGTAFSGAYAGVSISWQSLDVEQRGSLTGWPINFLTKGESDTIAGKLPDLSENKFRFGVQAGYNWRLGRLYAGPRFAVDFGEMEAGVSRVDTFIEDGDFSIGHHGKLSVSSDFLATASLKLGVAVTENIGVYGIGGLSVSDVDMNASGEIVASDGEQSVGFAPWQAANSETMIGWHIGGGVELELNDWNVFAEYTYHDLGELDSRGTIYGGLIAYTHDADVTMNVVKVGVNRRF